MIGLCAQSRMGKDTVADYMMTELVGWEKRSFGNELKKLISSYFDISMQEIEEYKCKTEIHSNVSIKMRLVLQLIGETFRQVSPDVWVNAAMRGLKKNVIFTDVRHENEMQSIRSRQGQLILLGRTKYLNMDPHPSESGLKDAIIWFLENTTDEIIKIESLPSVPQEYRKFTYFLRNDGTMKTLQQNIRKILGEIISCH